ncbi:cytosolic carboxypeptidase 4-like isoform X2 [Megalops cyprinoides]|uniref:cytosolic carboxypeptidase 4-like isoform X2 n=1 Tax=Megalops cyprinoides TaxID=118141 RepID=UPI0018649F1B|nr:cytosolic carboxypeptidase 4-like isoform X2 [Megalops cyprinoides]
MFSYSKYTNFTWRGTLRDWADGMRSERSRPCMATTAASGLEVLLSTLQDAGDVESTLNILSVLDELLSAGTDRRIHYMISKGGSEALLSALVNTARSFSPNYTILLPLLHLLAKVGQRDRRIGLKAENADAVLLTLSLLRQNLEQPRRAAACLWVLRVFCSSVSTAVLLGNNRCLDVVFKLISPYTTKHTRTVKAAIDALGALLDSKANSRSAVAKGYVSSLLQLYKDWHSKDVGDAHLPIRQALLHCLHQATNTSEGLEALGAAGGIAVLFSTMQTCLASKGLQSLVDSSIQLMRKCYPSQPVPLPSDQSAYIFPLLGGPALPSDTDPGTQDDTLEEDDSDDSKNEDPSSSENNDDLETDLAKLQERPPPDRPLELLGQYTQLCPELHHDFQDLDTDSEEVEGEDSDEEKGFSRGRGPVGRGSLGHWQGNGGSQCGPPLEKQTPPREAPPPPAQRAGGPAGAQLRAQDLLSSFLRPHGAGQDSHSALDRLLEMHRPCIPHHDPRIYASIAPHTKSVAGFFTLAFPDLWGHLPPQGQEPMAGRKPNVQRKKVFEDIQRLLCPEDIIDKIVFDMEDASPVCPSGPPDSLHFYSKFESGNLRKAIHVRRYEYDLILNADVNCSQHLQWFYFEVSRMQANVPYRFNIINCEKANSQFNYGMQPVLYSVQEALEGRPRWVRAGSEICYYRNNFCPSQQRGPTFYTLTFTVTFQHSDDVCYLAYHYPYTYSTLQTHLQVLEGGVDSRKVFFRKQDLCDSLAGNPCPLVTITGCPPSRSWKHLHELRKRPCVVLTGRVHPGESNASWVMKGTLDFLCSSDPVAESLREAYIFKIVPMLNPDGVINGTHRCSLSGGDLNRQWIKPDPILSPTIYHTKGLLYYLNSIGRTPLVFCDYHGHSRKKNVFLYGCSIKETLWQAGSPVNTATLKEDPGHRTIPKTLDRIAPAFSFNSCSYLVEKSRAATARVVVWREMGVAKSYTMESTYNGCDQGIYKGLQIGTRELEEMGLKFCQSLLPLRINSLLCSRKLLGHASALLQLDDSPLDHKSHDCFEDDEPPCAEEIEYLNDNYLRHSSDELDAEVDGNVSSSEEDEDEEEEEEAEEEEQPRNGLQHSDRKSRLITGVTHKDCVNAVSLRRNPCNGVDTTNGQYLS